MKQLMRTRIAVRRPVDRRRDHTADPSVLAELAVIRDARAAAGVASPLATG